MRALLAVLPVLALAACVGSLFKSTGRPLEVYQLSAASASIPADGSAVVAPLAAPPRVDLAILKPRVRAGLDTDLIAVLYPDRHLDHIAAARWSGPLDEVMQDLVLEAFRARRPGTLGVHADSSAFGSRYWLEIDVDDFEAEYAAGDAPPVVYCRLVARLGASSDRQVVGRFELEAHERAGANRVTAIVEAYNRAVDDALGRLVTQVAAKIPE